MSLLDWTESETISPPDRITIQWVTDATSTAASQTRKQVLISTSVSRSRSTYETISYQSADGKVSSQDVQVLKEDTKTTTIASVNQEYVTARLKYNRGLPSGDDEERSVTTYEHSISSDGPILSKETTEVHISFASLAGQLQGIPYRWSIVGGEYDYYDPPSGDIVGHRTIIEYNEVKTIEGRTVSITKTSRWVALGLTSEGKGSFERWMKAIKDVGDTSSQVIDDALQSYSELVFQGTEVSTSTGRIPVPSKPSDTDVAYSEVENGSNPTSTASPETVYGNNAGWIQYTPPGLSIGYLRADSNGDGKPNWADYIPPGIPWQSLSTEDSDYRNPVRVTSNEKSIRGRVVFDGQDLSGENPTVTETYEMPYAPDDYFYFDSSRVRRLHRSNSRQAAEQFGRVEAYLDVAHAFGQNIVTSFDRLPTLELSTVYVRLAGIEVAFLTDSLSYAFDASGMVVSSDLMILGVTGYYGTAAPATSWIRLASSPSALPQAPTPSTSVAMKANSISYPNGGVDPRNPAPVFALLGNTGTDAFGSYQGTPQLVGPTLEIDTFAIAAGPTVEVLDFSYLLNTGTDVEYLAAGPVADFRWVEIITVPAAPVTVGARVPVIATGASVVVPASAVSIAVKVPTVGTGASVAVPAASVTIAAVAPAIGGQLVTVVPAASVTVSAKVPASIGPQVDNYWSDWASQLYGVDRDWQPDWWAD